MTLGGWTLCLGRRVMLPEHSRTKPAGSQVGALPCAATWRILLRALGLLSLVGVLMLKLGVRCVRRAVSGAGLTDFGKAACVSLLLVLSCALSPAFAQASAGCTPAGGSGSKAVPYEIRTLCELQGISSRPAAYYVLMDNIDASETEGWNNRAGFRPIASTAADGFSGSFVNPGSFEISSLVISRSSETYVGLFSRLAAGATIRGVILVGSRTTGRDSVGSLVGFSDGVTDNNSATGSVFGQSNVGGLVGFSSRRSSIDNSYATGSVSGVDRVGGVVGNNVGSINYTYATSTVIGTGLIVGGLVGLSSGDISDSYATGSVSGGSLVGGLVGFISGGDISGSYATGPVSGANLVGGLTGYQDFGTGIRDSYATGSVSGNDHVGGLTGYQELGTSITDSYATGSVIGRADNVGGFVGSLGFSSSIRDSYATGSVSGRSNVGGLVGFSSSRSSIDNSSATGSVSGTGDNIGGLVGMSEGNISNSQAASAVTGRSSVGGLVGNSLGLISNSSAAGSAFGTGDNIGGLVGEQQGGSSIRDSYATGSVSGGDYVGGLVGNGLYFISNSYATGSVFGGDYVGGLVGFQVFRSGIRDSYATGSVSGDDYVGGFVGFLGFSSSIRDSYATGSVSGDDNVGGFVGFLGPNSSIRDSYATGSVSGDYYVGGLVGSGNGNIANSYYATRGWNNGLGEERTFTQLRCPMGASAAACPTESPKSSYQGWDAGVWDFGSATALPQLSSNLNSDLNRKPYIKNPSGLVNIGNARVKLLSLEADYLGSPPGEPITLTWSLSGVPSSLRHLVYFDLGGGTTSTTFTDSRKRSPDSSTVKLVVSGEFAGKGFDVVLKNDISANDDRIWIRITGVSPFVIGGEVQTQTILDSSTSTFLVFEAIDSDHLGSDGAGLSWSFFNRDGIAEGSTVVFSSTQTGGTVRVEVVRPSLDFYDVGSFVLEIESLAGAKTTVTITIETECSPIPGIDLMAGQTGKGTSDKPYRIKRLCQLQDISSSPAAYYELVDDIDASETEDWNNGAGFEPIASTVTGGFSGSFVNTDNYVISSLTISRSGANNPAGLFSKLARGATIRGVILVGSRTIGGDNVGSLVGYSLGVIDNSSATGSVSGRNDIGGLAGRSNGSINNSYATGSVSGQDNIGGLVGVSEGNNSNSYAAGSVSGKNYIGGLVGFLGLNSRIRDSYAAGSVTGRDYVGGLVGFQRPNTVSNSYATGRVSGQDEIGGLVGWSEGNINNSFATGSVKGQNRIGGLVGSLVLNSRTSNSYATGSVKGQNRIGGLVGFQGSNSRISNSYATGSVSLGIHIGGLVGVQSVNSRISNSYATGSVIGQSSVGGLVGWSQGNINNSYATGSVIGQSSVGGLAGRGSGNISNSYHAGRNNGLGIKRSFAQLRCPTTASATCLLDSQGGALTYEGWDTSVWGFGTAMDMDLPQLSSNLNPGLNLKPYIKGSTERMLAISFTGTRRFSLEADYPGPPGEPVTLTWSLSGVPPALSGLVYFVVDPEKGTTSTTLTVSSKVAANFSPVTLVIAGNRGLVGKSFDVVLENSIFNNVDDRVQVQIVVARSPEVDGGRDQIGTIQDGLLSNILSFSATDPDNPDSDSAGLSWSFLSTDIAEGSTVRFSGSTGGGTVEVEVVRPSLDFYGVGSFVLEVKSPADVDTTFTVTIETVCSTVPGEDLMAGQTGAGTSNDNPYQIRRICQLQDVSSIPTAHYELAANIDASRTRDWNDDAGFEPIASFSGSFVSTNNYVIRSLTISRSGTDNVGLFSRLAKGATIRGVILVGSHTNGRDGVGSLVGFNAGVIEDCSVTGSIVSGRNQIGGLVGTNAEGASMSRSYAIGSVFGRGDNVGGLVGGNEGNISDSYAMASISERGDYVGGLVGRNGGGCQHQEHLRIQYSNGNNPQNWWSRGL